ncbi:MAG: DUF456 domain-containing protein [Flavobacteriaceae bacterium]|nr:DUF456 domain-containing protein [Flavobacteriaceae bacterium]
MDESLLTIISLICLVTGFFGSFLPVLPGTVLSWVGLLLFKYTSYADYGWPTLIFCGLIVILVQVVNYILPAYGSKKFGGSRAGIIGASLGLLVGIIFAPFGFISIIIAPFLGAFLGEYIFQKRGQKEAFKAAFGTFVGFILSTGISMLVSLAFLVFVMWKLSSNANWNWI